MMSNAEYNDSGLLSRSGTSTGCGSLPPVNSSTLSSAGKTPTTTHWEAELPAAVDGGKRVCACIDGMPCQGLHVISP